MDNEIHFIGPPPLTSLDIPPRMEGDGIRTREGALPAVLQTLELLLESLAGMTGLEPISRRFGVSYATIATHPCEDEEAMHYFSECLF